MARVCARAESLYATFTRSLQNEPHASSWAKNLPIDWDKGAARMGDHVLSECPRWLILVEGVGYDPGAPGGDDPGAGFWWGENLVGVRTAPVALSNPLKLVYSPHVYGPSVYQQHCALRPPHWAASSRARCADPSRPLLTQERDTTCPVSRPVRWWPSYGLAPATAYPNACASHAPLPPLARHRLCPFDDQYFSKQHLHPSHPSHPSHPLQTLTISTSRTTCPACGTSILRSQRSSLARRSSWANLAASTSIRIGNGRCVAIVCDSTPRQFEQHNARW